MYSGKFRTDTFNPGKPTITMVNWVEPTLMNTGETTIYINGQPVLPGDGFLIGPAGVKMNGIINIQFPDSASKNEAKVNYVLLDENCQ